MFRAIYLWAALLAFPLAACGDVVITKPQYGNPAQSLHRAQYAPLVLECGNRRDTARAVSRLTLAQLNNPDAAVRFTSGLPRTCRSSNVTASGILQGRYSAITRDGWHVVVVDWVQSNGFPITYVDTSRAYLGRAVRPQYGQAVPRRYDDSRKQRRHRDNRLEVDDIQRLLKKRVEEERRRLKRQ
jgi:hypothetical protein